jgi:predicted DNA-binding transcriptional regulator YafY
MNLSRLKRLLKLIGVLQAGKGYNVNALAAACGISRRTAFRDINALKQAGVPLAFDDVQQRYRIPGTYFLPPTNFSAEEALAVIVLCHEFSEAKNFPYFAHAHSAALKLESALPAPLRDYLRDVSGAVQIRLRTRMRSDNSQSLYQRLIDAIAQRRSLRMQYDSVYDGQVIATKLSPYRLLFNRHSWYVIGRSSIHRATRTFHVGRIVSMEVTDDTFRPPTNFSLDTYLRGAWNLIPEKGRRHEVHIQFSKMVARNVAAVTWHGSQRTELREDGTLDYRATVSGLNDISWWILGYGDQAKVLQPAKLREIVVERAKSLLQQYSPPAKARQRKVHSRKTK